MDHNVLSDPSRWRGPPPPKPPLSAPPIVRPPQDELPPIPPRAVLLDSAGRLNQDLACRQCGYNLRGLAIAGTCPECQTPIGKSVRPDLLRFAEPRWVDRLATGTLWIIIGTFVKLAGRYMLVIALIMITAAAGGGTGAWVSVAVVASAALASIQLIGYWLITTPEPSITESEPRLSARRVARWCLVATIINAPIEALTQGRGGAVLTMQWLSGYGLALGVLALAAAAAQVVGYFALFLYAERIALRIPEPGLARQCRILKWGVTITTAAGAIYGIVMILMLPMMFAGMAGPTPAFLLVSGFGCVSGIVTLVFFIWAIIVMFRFRSQLSRQAALARATWDGRELRDTILDRLDGA